MDYSQNDVDDDEATIGDGDDDSNDDQTDDDHCLYNEYCYDCDFDDWQQPQPQPLHSA